MRLLTAMAVLVLMSVFPAVPQAGAQKPADKDEQRIAGTWVMALAEKEGKKQPVDDTFRLTFTGDGKFSLKQKGPDAEFSGTYKLMPGKTPKEIDLIVEGKSFLGIYAFEGDDFRLCLGEIEKARPTEFVAPKGTITMLVVLKRVKK